jgi:hypothetical protein
LSPRGIGFPESSVLSWASEAAPTRHAMAHKAPASHRRKDRPRSVGKTRAAWTSEVTESAPGEEWAVRKAAAEEDTAVKERAMGEEMTAQETPPPDEDNRGGKVSAAVVRVVAVSVRIDVAPVIGGLDRVGRSVPRVVGHVALTSFPATAFVERRHAGEVLDHRLADPARRSCIRSSALTESMPARRTLT